MNIFYQPDIGQSPFLSEDESHHAIKVLRMSTGDSLTVVDGKGSTFIGVIKKADARRCEISITKTIEHPPRNFYIHLAIAPTKNADRIEWMVEKAVELGIEEISFLHCDNSEKKNINVDRVHKVAVSAMKQSQQPWLPTINALKAFPSILSAGADQKFIAFVDSENPNHLKKVIMPGKRYLILVGPEGDFSKEELRSALASGFEKVSLGPNRLRTETAGLAACHILNLLNQ